MDILKDAAFWKELFKTSDFLIYFSSLLYAISIICLKDEHKMLKAVFGVICIVILASVWLLRSKGILS